MFNLLFLTIGILLADIIANIFLWVKYPELKTNSIRKITVK